MVRFEQPGSVWYAGFGAKALQPLPAPLQAPSVQPRGFDDDLTRLVPPTASTWGEAAGNSAPKPLSPEETVRRIPGWL